MTFRSMMAPAAALMTMLAVSLLAAGAASAQQPYVPQPPVTRTYAQIAAQYGVMTSEAAAGILSTDSLTDLRVDPFFLDPLLPSQIHLIYHSATEVLVTWFTSIPQQTNDTTTPFIVPFATRTETRVMYGTTHLHSTAKGTADYYRMTYAQTPIQNYASGKLMTNFTNYTSGVNHRVILTNLKPSTTYMYQVGDFHRGKVSAVFTFKTLPQSSTTFTPVKIGVFADIGVSLNSTRTVDRLTKANVDLAILAGDYAYANIFDSSGNFGFFLNDAEQYSQGIRWDMLGQMLQPLFSKVPFLGCQGNHEREKQADDGGVHFRPWLQRYGNNVPWQQSGGSPFYYSANVGPVHVISVSPYVDFSATSAQYSWLEADLAKVDRAVTPWILVMFHAPWYVTTVSHFQENECHRQITEPLLHRYGVDFVISGHSHLYERSNKVYNYNVDACGATHLVVGNAGIGLNTAFADSASYAPTLTNTTAHNASGPCPLPNNPTGQYVWLNTTQICTHTYANGNFCPSTQPDYSAMRDISLGPSTIEFVNATHARVQYLRNLDPDGAPPADEAWVVRDPACSNPQRRRTASA